MPAPPYPQSIVDALEVAGERPVFEHGDRVVSGGELLDDIRHVSASLRSAGVRPGDGVAMLLGVSPEAFAAIVAAHVVGARVAGTRPSLTPDQLRYVLRQDISAVVVDSPAALARVREAAPEMARPLAVGPIPGLADLLTTPADGELVLTGRPDDVGRIIYTSGSTGEPKGCARTYAAATATIITVPRLYEMVKEQRERPVDLSSLRALLVYGSALPPDRLAEALAALGPVVFHGYGQAETGVISMLTPAEMATSPGTLASVGRPVDTVTIEVRDPYGRPLPCSAEGEIWVRTPSQSCGYWDNPEESAEVFVDGWVRARDLGYLDADGYLHLVGRTRDVVIVNAVPYYVGAIERSLSSHPAVAEAYVVCAPDERTGEAPHAFVVPAQAQPLPVEALRRIVAERLGKDCVPRTVTALDRVPIAASGKPDKRRLLAAVPTASTGTSATNEAADGSL